MSCMTIEECLICALSFGHIKPIETSEFTKEAHF